MRYKIYRASTRNYNDEFRNYDDITRKPCDEAVYEEDRWRITFTTIQELEAFVKKYDKIVIDYYDNTICIYDDYIE